MDSSISSAKFTFCGDGKSLSFSSLLFEVLSRACLGDVRGETDRLLLLMLIGSENERTAQ